MRSERGAFSEQPRDVMIQRLYRTIDLKLAQLEARMAHEDELSVADHERETACAWAIDPQL